MNTLLIWILATVVFGLFVYFIPYKNIKIIQNKLDKIIGLLEKKMNRELQLNNKKVRK